MDTLLSNLPIFAGVIGVIIIFLVCAWRIKKGLHHRHHQWDAFWSQEREAAFTTKSHFPTSLLLTIDRDKIPYIENENYQQAYNKLLIYADHKMVYLNNLSNLEIKKQYGVNYFNELITYEETFYYFMNELMQYADLLREGDFLSESLQVLEYVFSFGYKSAKMSNQIIALQDQMMSTYLPLRIKDEMKRRIQIMLQ